MVRPGRRSAFELYKLNLIKWLNENKEKLKGRNFWFKTFSKILKSANIDVSDKTAKKLAIALDRVEVDGIKLELWSVDGELFIHINPPDCNDQGFWAYLPDFIMFFDAVAGEKGWPRLKSILPSFPPVILPPPFPPIPLPNFVVEKLEEMQIDQSEIEATDKFQLL